MFTLDPHSPTNSRAVVWPCFPFAIWRFTLSLSNFENSFLSTASPISFAIVKSVTRTPNIARQYTMLTAFLPRVSKLEISRILPHPNFSFSRITLKTSFAGDFSFTIRSIKKSGITIIEQFLKLFSLLELTIYYIESRLYDNIEGHFSFIYYFLNL
jgi:hypothetical protein